MSDFEILFRFLQANPGENILTWEDDQGNTEELTIVAAPSKKGRDDS